MFIVFWDVQHVNYFMYYLKAIKCSCFKKKEKKRKEKKRKDKKRKEKKRKEKKRKERKMFTMLTWETGLVLLYCHLPVMPAHG